MENLENVNFWRQQFGFFPIHINPLTAKNKYLMLNGGKHDFCLQTKNDEDDFVQNYFNYSWSTDTKNFIVLGEDSKIKIYNWFSDKKVDEFNSNRVIENIDNFYRYLA